MTISNRSVEKIAEALKEDFNVFVHEFYEQQLSELLADAAVLFVDTEFGAMDGNLASDLAVKLVQRQSLTVNNKV